MKSTIIGVCGNHRNMYKTTPKLKYGVLIREMTSSILLKVRSLSHLEV